VTHILPRLRAFAQRRRKTLTVCAGVVFVGGFIVSLGSLKLDPTAISITPLILMTAVLAPLSLGLAAFGLQLSAHALGRKMGFHEAFAFSAFARITELLPVPGGAMTRGAALMRAGASLADSARMIGVTALLTLSMSVALGGAPLLLAGYKIGYAVIAGGAVAATGATIWIARCSDARTAVLMVVLRLASLGVNVLRIVAAFSAIGFAVGPVRSAIFVVCDSLGSAFAIAPGGLGVSEIIAAALAQFIAIAPAAAFLTVALNRMAGFCASGVIVLLVFSKENFLENAK